MSFLFSLGLLGFYRDFGLYICCHKKTYGTGQKEVDVNTESPGRVRSTGNDYWGVGRFRKTGIVN